MNIYQFFIIAGFKLLAIQIMLVGIFLQFKERAKLSMIVITVGSLLFCVAGNTLLFLSLSYNNLSKKGVTHANKTTHNNCIKGISNYYYKYQPRASQKPDCLLRRTGNKSERNFNPVG